MSARAFFRRNLVPLVAFAVCGVVLTAFAWPRPLRQSRDPHFVVQAKAWLDGKLSIDRWPRGADDPAKVETVTTRKGEVVRGRRITSRRVFRTTDSREIAVSELAPGSKTTHYMSFPPVPSALMLPQVALRGEKANDVTFSLFFAAMVPAAFLILLRRLREAGLSTRTPREDLVFTALLTFGTVFFFTAVQGRVWFTAHVIGVFLAILYAWASVEARHPIVAGLALGLAFGTRTPMLFMFPLFLFEAWRMHRRGAWRKVLLFGAPIVVIGLALAWHNYARFGEPTEFGHSYLAVRQQAQIEQYGLFDPHYLVRNLVIAFALVPGVVSKFPWLSISGHGLAMWVTTPALLLLFVWARDRHPLRLALWLTIALVAVWSLTYQNSGWVQFGYRFSLDYMVFLILLLALSRRRLGPIAYTLIALSLAINLFGAITFDRVPRTQRWDNWSYDHPGPPFWVRH